jgi:hypothetical protein
MTPFCQCTNPETTWAGADKTTPFCKVCLKRIEVKEPFTPDPDRAVWIKKEPKPCQKP